jgi:hypothetical protein
VHIDWATLTEIAVVAAAAALAVVLLVTFAVVGWSARSGRWVPGPSGRRAAVAHPVTGTAVALLCVLAAALIVGFGLYLIVA